VYPAVALLARLPRLRTRAGVLQFAGGGLIDPGTLGVNLKWTLMRKQPASAYALSA
jgi:hypothetical protein